MAGLEIGLRGYAKMQANQKNTAKAWGSGDVPVSALAHPQKPPPEGKG